ncbi:hypothetical protein P0D88_51915 [Paraburkholderia sp. RL18-103-BIB-C]|jgi:hypothetical protein|uniref:hypothetical protein n=1 Tax=unclassified Paraburkholderia TaxID=2615204 RepID=UPI0038B79BE3
MEAYNPDCAAAPESWLELDEQERIAPVETGVVQKVRIWGNTDELIHTGYEAVF